jgi:hypothetical protein
MLHHVGLSLGRARQSPLKAGDPSPPAGECHFTRIAEGGFGDGWNSYPHSMAWFRGALYVGTTRANLCSIKAARPPGLVFWPIRCPDDVYAIDRRAEIWRFDPGDSRWERVYQSPWYTAPERAGGEGSTSATGVPRDIGYRGMRVFRGLSDEQEALYVLTWSPSKTGQPSIMLRSTDGREFVPLQPHEEDSTVTTYRALCSFKGRLFTAPAGRTAGWQAGRHMGAEDCAVGQAVVLENADPLRGPWTMANVPSFGDRGNLAVFDLHAYNDHLYAGTVNAGGFQLWKTDGEGKPPYRWSRVLTSGAYRGPLNEGVATLCAHGGYLYIGTGIQRGGYDRPLNIGPAAAEILRVGPDDSWDVIVGSPRKTPMGLKSPLSRFGPGFDNFFAGYFWTSVSDDGWLYMGTYDWSVLYPYIPADKFPARMAKAVHYLSLDQLAAGRAGCELWRTRDGIKWEPLTRDGFGNAYNFGIRRLASTPHGLFVGTANPFGPEVGQLDDDGQWRYRPNPRGGLEVWWLRRDPQRTDR